MWTLKKEEKIVTSKLNGHFEGMSLHSSAGAYFSSCTNLEIFELLN